MFDFEKFAEYDFLMKFSIIFSAVLLLSLAAGAVIAHIVLAKKGRPNAITTRDITVGAGCLAASFGLGFIGFRFPQGGTVTPASTLPVMLYCYYFGFRKGLVVCAAITALQFLQNPYIVHPMSAVLDYVIPFLALIFFGVFAYNGKAAGKSGTVLLKAHSRFFIAAVPYVLIRYFSTVLSGVVFYSEWAWEGYGAWGYSLAYNFLCFIPDAAIALIAAVGVLSSKSFNAFMTSEGHALQNTDAAKEHD